MKSRLLSVPIYHQPPEKPWCGPTAAKMVLEYHGVRISIPEIARRSHASAGVWMPNLAMLFMRLGFAITLYEWDSSFPGRFMDLPDDKTKEQLLQWSKRRNLKYKNDRQYRFAVRRYLKKDGKFIPRMYEGFSIRKLQAAIHRGEPIIFSIAAAPLWGEWDRVRTMEHCVVLTSINSRTAVIHDPVYGKIKLLTELLRFACYHSSTVSIMYIRKNKTHGI